MDSNEGRISSPYRGGISVGAHAQRSRSADDLERFLSLIRFEYRKKEGLGLDY
jgi:hypothetical protein